MKSAKVRCKAYWAACDQVRDGLFTSNGLPADVATARAVFHRIISGLGIPDGSCAYNRHGIYNDGPSAVWGIITPQTRFAYGILVRSGVWRELLNDAWRLGIDSAYITASQRNALACVSGGAREAHPCDKRINEGCPFMLRMAQRPLNPEVFRYDRALGVELECFGDVTMESLANVLPSWARAGTDGSVRPTDGKYAHEVRALFVRRELEPRLFRLCALLREQGLKVNSSCGLHIHLDQRGEDGATVTKRAKIMDSWLSALSELVPLSRRANSFCRFGVSSTDRYRAINLVAFQKYKTLEVRLHSGTVDYTKVLSWIRLCELLAAMRTKPKAGGCIATLEQLPLPSHDLAYWRARHRELNPAMYNNNGATSEQES